MDENKHPYTIQSMSNKNKLIGAIESLGSIPEAACLYGFVTCHAQKLKEKYDLTRTVAKKPHSGAPFKVTEHDKHHMVLISHRNHRLPFTELGNMMPVPLCKNTVQKHLKDYSYGCYKARKVPFLTLANCKARRAYVRMFRRCGMGFWKWKIFQMSAMSI
jgi:hypothetical protein